MFLVFCLASFGFFSPTPTSCMPIQLVSYPNGALVPLEPWRMADAQVFEVVQEPWRLGKGELVEVDGKDDEVEGKEHLQLDPTSRLARLLSQVVFIKIKSSLSQDILKSGFHSISQINCLLDKYFHIILRAVDKSQHNFAIPCQLNEHRC